MPGAARGTGNFTQRHLALRVALLVLAARPSAFADDRCAVRILAYHRFGPQAVDSMTVRTTAFAAQLQYLQDHGYPVVPLRAVVDCLRDPAAHLPERAVALTADDGHRTVATEMLPLVRRFRVPVTLFIYPTAISNAGYALTWAQLRELRDSGWFEVQSHTTWHPNFRDEKRRLDAQAYQALVRTQLAHSREVLEAQLGTPVDLVAWPFGLFDEGLLAAARAQGFVGGFSLERRAVHSGDDPLALPRFLMVDAVGPREFARLLGPVGRDGG